MAIKAAGAAIVLGLCLFLIVTVVRTDGRHPGIYSAGPAVSPAGMPVAVARVFERACKDGHSNRTEWPWYAKLPPLSLAIAADVNRGKKFFNMSEWEQSSPGRKRGFLSAIEVNVLRGSMPPRPYRWLHPQSTLTSHDRAMLANWTKEEGSRLRSQFPAGRYRPSTTGGLSLTVKTNLIPVPATRPHVALRPCCEFHRSSGTLQQVLSNTAMNGTAIQSNSRK